MIHAKADRNGAHAVDQSKDTEANLYYQHTYQQVQTSTEMRRGLRFKPAVGQPQNQRR